ncbi:DUF4012 domain-containing protein [Virgisporangium ochraceum]|uniref:DUF4012 domain-containing protein n=1 Tax=Virgisporangium ochraceum TaxID=65505 RepID=A0A8J4E8V1_9ACTN|nr:DUF4012 domain-containing protein [Virgisporangium ochraceum]GIJ66535.1 hypothetical protein Voc01_014520 [Virgisporangium ochraceum]
MDEHRTIEQTPFAFTPPDTEPNIEFERVRRSDPAPRRRRRFPFVVAAGLTLVLLAAVGWVGVGGWRAAGNLRTAAALVATMRQQVLSGDLPAARVTLRSLRKETTAAQERTSGIGWRAAGLLPWVGDDLDAARTIATTLADLADNGLPPLLDAAETLTGGGLTPAAGRIDLDALSSAAGSLTAGSDVIRRSTDRIAAIPTGGLDTRTRTAVTQLDGGLARLTGLLAPASRAANLLPEMLGASAPRRYLVLFQNLAEVRATGGMPGAFVVIEANRGAVTIVGQGSAAGDLKTFEQPVLPLDADAADLYTDRIATYPANINLTPHFPTVAQLAREMYRIRTGTTVDGVLATDPVALSYLLSATGPVPMPSGPPLTADSAVRLLLSQVYAGALSSAQQDAYFATAARATFDALTRRPGDPRGLATQLMRAVTERRVLFWSSDPDEEAALAGTAVEGALPVDDGAKPGVGLFLNDGSGAKLSYYLTQSAEVTTGDCTGDGRRELSVKVTLGSSAPASGLSKSVLGLGKSGDPYTVRTHLMVFSPTDGSIADAYVDGVSVPIGSGFERGRQVAVATIDLPPGTRKTFSVTLITGPLPTVDTPVTPVVWTTPGVSPWRTTITAGKPCDK